MIKISQELCCETQNLDNFKHLFSSFKKESKWVELNNLVYVHVVHQFSLPLNTLLSPSHSTGLTAFMWISLQAVFSPNRGA